LAPVSWDTQKEPESLSLPATTMCVPSSEMSQSMKAPGSLSTATMRFNVQFAPELTDTHMPIADPPAATMTAPLAEHEIDSQTCGTPLTWRSVQFAPESIEVYM